MLCVTHGRALPMGELARAALHSGSLGIGSDAYLMNTLYNVFLVFSNKPINIDTHIYI